MLQNSGRLCSRRLAPHPSRNPGLSVFRYSELGRALDRARNRDRISDRARDGLGL